MGSLLGKYRNGLVINIRSLEDLEHFFKDLDEREKKLWELISEERIKIEEILEVIQSMRDIVGFLILALNGEEKVIDGSLFVAEYNRTPMFKQFQRDIIKLRGQLGIQISMLRSILEKSQEEIVDILNYGKKEGDNISKTSQMIHEMLGRCEEEIKSLREQKPYQ